MSKKSIENLVENVSLFIGLVIQLQQLQTSKFQVNESEVLISIDWDEIKEASQKENNFVLHFL